MENNITTNQDIQLKDLQFASYISRAEIQAKVDEMALQLRADFGEKKPIFIAILNGAFVFAADLIRAFDRDCEIQFVKLSSYEGTASTGDIIQNIGLAHDVSGEHVILIEDIIDTGNTLDWFIPEIKKLNPASFKVASLLVKGDPHRFSFAVDYYSFHIEDKFVVGYGLDYDGLGRNLSEIYQLKD
jgi:hypoxanthine phosphoribosyltransferase